MSLALRAPLGLDRPRVKRVPATYGSAPAHGVAQLDLIQRRACPKGSPFLGRRAGIRKALLTGERKQEVVFPSKQIEIVWCWLPAAQSPLRFLLPLTSSSPSLAGPRSYS